jgi:hypothetical protein
MAGYTEDHPVGYSYSRKRRNLVYRPGGLVQVKLLYGKDIKDLYLAAIIHTNLLLIFAARIYMKLRGTNWKKNTILLIYII